MGDIRETFRQERTIGIHCDKQGCKRDYFFKSFPLLSHPLPEGWRIYNFDDPDTRKVLCPDHSPAFYEQFCAWLETGAILLLWPTVVFALGVLTLLCVFQLYTRKLDDAREDRISLGHRAQVDAQIRQLREELAEVKDDVQRVKMGRDLGAA